MRHGLTGQQKRAVELGMEEKSKFGIQEYEKVAEGVTRRTLQRELKEW